MSIVRENGDKPTRCLFDAERRLTPCWPLDDSLEGPFGRGVRSRGVVLNSMVNMETRKFSRSMVTLRSGENCGKERRGGFEVNYCPFCGTPMNEQTEAHERGEEPE